MIESLYGNFKDVLVMTWPMVFVSMVVLISLRLTYLFKSKKEIIIYNEIILFFFAFYVLCLFQIVTSTDDSLVGSSNFIPFKEIFRYKLFSRLFFKNVIGNVLLFLPYGYFVSRTITSKKFFLTFFLVLLASVSIEFTQLSIGRVFDVDDITLNLIGGMLGYYLHLGFDKIYNSLPKVLKSRTFLNIVFSILFIAFIILLIVLLA